MYLDTFRVSCKLLLWRPSNISVRGRSTGSWWQLLISFLFWSFSRLRTTIFFVLHGDAFIWSIYCWWLAILCFCSELSTEMSPRNVRYTTTGLVLACMCCITVLRYTASRLLSTKFSDRSGFIDLLPLLLFLILTYLIRAPQLRVCVTRTCTVVFILRWSVLDADSATGEHTSCPLFSCLFSFSFVTPPRQVGFVPPAHQYSLLRFG